MKIEDLPERYQKQAREQIGRTSPKNAHTRTKYNNTRAEYNGLKFDSKKEKERFVELVELQSAGEISDLRLQVNFTLREGYTLPNGECVKGTIYKADFTYRDKDGDLVIEDVKGVKTDVYKLKRKLMLDKGYLIHEI